MRRFHWGTHSCSIECSPSTMLPGRRQHARNRWGIYTCGHSAAGFHLLKKPATARPRARFTKVIQNMFATTAACSGVFTHLFKTKREDERGGLDQGPRQFRRSSFWSGRMRIICATRSSSAYTRIKVRAESGVRRSPSRLRRRGHLVCGF